MDASTWIAIGSFLVALMMVTLQMVNTKTSRDDLRVKAEVNYVQSLERRVQVAEERSNACEGRERIMREELNMVRGELFNLQMATGNLPSQLRRSMPPRPRQQDEEEQP